MRHILAQSQAYTRGTRSASAPAERHTYTREAGWRVRGVEEIARRAVPAASRSPSVYFAADPSRTLVGDSVLFDFVQESAVTDFEQTARGGAISRCFFESAAN